MRFTNESKLYADDSKIIAVISSLEEAISLQKDIDALTEWTRDWMMRLNTSKCRVMYFGGSNVSRIDYTMEDLDSGCRVPLEDSCCEKDLGVQITSDLTWRKHISTIVSKANKVLGMLLKTFTSRDSDL